MELISIIIPVYNVERYLDRTMKSVVSQTYPSIEVILIDDGSTDCSGEICDNWSFQDHRVRVFHQENLGVSVCRNTGIRAASGKYIMFIDSDDYVSHRLVESLYKALSDNDSDMSICSFVKGAENDYVFEEGDEVEAEVISGVDGITRIFDSGMSALQYAAPWGKLYKKELFEGICFPAGKIFEDIYTTHKLLYNCKNISVVNSQLIYYYQRDDSIMGARYSLRKLDYLDALEERRAFFEEKGLLKLRDYTYDDELHSLIWEYSRCRDILHNKEILEKIKQRYNDLYKWGYSSCRHKSDTKTILLAFRLNPELVVYYWRWKSFWKRAVKKKSK